MVKRKQVPSSERGRSEVAVCTLPNRRSVDTRGKRHERKLEEGTGRKSHKGEREADGARKMLKVLS